MNYQKMKQIIVRNIKATGLYFLFDIILLVYVIVFALLSGLFVDFIRITVKKC